MYYRDWFPDAGGVDGNSKDNLDKELASTAKTAMVVGQQQ